MLEKAHGLRTESASSIEVSCVDRLPVYSVDRHPVFKPVVSVIGESLRIGHHLRLGKSTAVKDDPSPSDQPESCRAGKKVGQGREELHVRVDFVSSAYAKMDLSTEVKSPKDFGSC
ncbi:hypothetical protein LA080_005903 [Diaporthe eres]|nr:hypothetical protein LA080_005903 [Diaporthe eres]